MEEEIFKNIMTFTRNIKTYENMLSSTVLPDISLSEIVCIDTIKELQDINLSAIAKKMGMTKGAMTKITQKLIKKGYLQKYNKAENKKEVFFKLEKKGEALYKEYKTYYEIVKNREIGLYKQFSQEEKASVLNFLRFLNQHLLDVTNEIE